MKRITVSQLYFDLFSDYLKKLDGADLHKPVDGIDDKNRTDVYQKRVDQSEIEEIIGKIEKRTKNLSFGLKIGEHIHPSDYGTIGYSLMNFPNLYQALNFAAEHKHLLNEAFSTRLVRKGTRYHYQTNNISVSRNLATLVELDFASAIQLARFFVGAQKDEEVEITQVNFQHNALCHLKDYERVFKCPVSFGQKVNEFVISKHVLDIPIRSANPQVLNLMLRKVERWKQEFVTQSSFSQRVIRFITSREEEKIPDIAAAADEFNISVSALKKRLLREGLNYSALCDAVKKDQAVKMLANSSIQVKEIYIKLNFASSSAFNRAFKRWTNMTPTEYRARNK